MHTATTILMFLVLAIPASAYDDLSAALRDASSSDVYSHLPEPAVQYVIDSCSLDWQTAWDYPIGSRNQYVVWAHVSRDRKFCVLTRARWSEFGLHGDATFALVSADSGLVWTREGTVVSPPVVSDSGTAALFQQGKESPEWPYIPVRLTLVALSGEALFTISWPEHIRRPLQRRAVAEASGFTSDGEAFIATMNVAEPSPEHPDEYNNTVLHCVDLVHRSDRRQGLGAFWVRSLEFTDHGALLHGTWRRLFTLDSAYTTGYYSITPPSCDVQKTVVDTVGASIR